METMSSREPRTACPRARGEEGAPSSLGTLDVRALSCRAPLAPGELMKSGSVAKRLLVALGCLGAECSRSSAAVADSHRTSALSWVELPGAEGCGGAPAIAKAVEDRLGRHAIVSPAEADLSIEARADRSGHPLLWHAVVVLRRADGEILGIRELGARRTTAASFARRWLLPRRS